MRSDYSLEGCKKDGKVRAIGDALFDCNRESGACAHPKDFGGKPLCGLSPLYNSPPMREGIIKQEPSSRGGR